jgi:protein O-mannosyl-transferase
MKGSFKISNCSDQARGRYLPLLIAIALTITVLVSYWGVLDNDFINYDDPGYVTENPHVKDGLTWDGIGWAFTASYVSNWHPLTWLSLMLDHDLFGMNAAGYHWTNAILHGFAGLVLFFALGRMTGQPWCSGLVAGLFLVHPLHVESVAWVAERKDILSALFWMLGMWSYARYAERTGMVRYAGVVLFFLLGLLSKPMVVTFPFVLLILDYWPLGRMAGGRQVFARLLYEKIPLFLLSAASCVITFLVQWESEAVTSIENLPVVNRIGNALIAYAHYLVKSVWPVHLAVFYPHPGHWPGKEILLALALLLLITLLVMLNRKRFPYLTAGWLWYLGTLVPVIGLVQVGAQAMADRYTYLPLIGIFVMAAWAGADLLKKIKLCNAMGGVIACGVIVVLVIMTRAQVGYWKDSFTLFTHTNRVTDKNFQAQNNVGRALAAENKYEEAVEYYHEAMKSNPNFLPAYINLGCAQMEQGKFEAAIHSFTKALSLKPGDGTIYFNRGQLYTRMKKWDEAIADYRYAMKKDPYNASLRNNLGIALTHRKQLDEAIHEYREAIRLNPKHAGAHNNLAMILAGRGEIDGAILHFREALRYQPDFANAHYQISPLLKRKGMEKESEYHLREAVRLDPEITKKDDHSDHRQHMQQDRVGK